jgi:orotate phosphoribosyltransferase-like protein
MNAARDLYRPDDAAVRDAATLHRPTDQRGLLLAAQELRARGLRLADIASALDLSQVAVLQLFLSAAHTDSSFAKDGDRASLNKDVDHP